MMTIRIDAPDDEEPETTEQENTEHEETKSEETEPVEATKPNNNNTGIDPDFKAAMDAYESFYNEYCEFMKKYYANPADLTLIAKYAEMLSKVEEIDKTFEEWEEDDLNAEELNYYLEVQGRVAKKLSEIVEQ